MAGIAAEEVTALVTDFPEYDEELLKSMLEDQAGDVLELRAVLRVGLSSLPLCLCFLSQCPRLLGQVTPFGWKQELQHVQQR